MKNDHSISTSHFIGATTMNQLISRGHLKSRNLLAFVVAVDIVFIVIYILRWFKSVPFLGYWRFSLANDWGFPEIFQYCQELIIIGLLVALFVHYRNIVYLAWIAIFTFVILDDSMKFHEYAGTWIGNNLAIQPMFGIRIVDIGELIFLGLVGLVCLSLLATGYYLSTPMHRKISMRLIGLMFVFALCGGAFDSIHEMVHNNPVLTLIFGIAEDGGEMLVMSVIVWYTFRLVFPQTMTTAESSKPIEPLSSEAPSVFVPNTRVF